MTPSRIALVTGASGGIGRAAAVGLAEDGCAVACGYHQDDAGAKETVRLIEDAGGTAAAFGADVTHEDEIRRLVDEVSAWAGPPAILVASAGTSRDGLAIRYPVDAFEGTLAVNLTGAFLCGRAVLPGMLRARWGRIVMVSSAAALKGNAGQTAYSASKAGLLGLVRSLAREYGSRGVTVNAVCPGVIETAMTAALPDGARERLIEQTPAGRAGMPEEAAAAIRFLASEGASFVNGAVVTVDGGLTA